jgi:hypothetical protein
LLRGFATTEHTVKVDEAAHGTTTVAAVMSFDR